MAHSPSLDLINPAATRPTINIDRAPFTTLTIIAIVLSALGGLWAVIDPRLLDGVPVWMKPLKFAISFVVLFATLAMLEPRLSQATTRGWPYRIVVQVMATAFLAEMAYMIFQAAQVQHSHFNLETPFTAFMYTVVMAVGAVSLVAGVGIIGWLAARDTGAQLGDGLRSGVAWGFGLSFILTLIVAGYMSSGTGHFVGLHPDGAPTIPLLGWSGVTGDLRPAHFASLHAMQFLPLLGLWLDRRKRTGQRRIVVIAAFCYAILTLGLFAQALLGMPMVPLG